MGLAQPIGLGPALWCLPVPSTHNPIPHLMLSQNIGGICLQQSSGGRPQANQLLAEQTDHRLFTLIDHLSGTESTY